jgi:hypothetical protein
MQASTITRKLAGTTAGTTNDLAHIDIGYRARLVAFTLSIAALANYANGDVTRTQVSVASVGSLGTNDAQGVLAEAGINCLITTSGMSQLAANIAQSGLGIILPAGTRVYLHTLCVGNQSTAVGALLFLEPF